MAGVQLGFLKFVLGFDSIQFRKGMTDAERDMVKLQKKFEGFGNKLQSIGKTMTLGITAPLAAIGLKSFETAKDVQEMQSAFDVSFGSMAGSVRAWAEQTGNALGRSTQEIQSGALAFQELFSKALDPAKSAQMSKTFAVLTQDLASFKNLSNEVAQQKLFSGLSGEAEPLRAVGVFLSDAKVQAKALELGLTGVNGKLTEEQKILARAAVIQQELAKASGDVLRTQDSAANQIKKAEAAWQELQVVIGTKLLPVLTPLIEKLASALTWFVQLPKPVQDMALGIAAVSAAVGPLVLGFGSLVKGVGYLLPMLTKMPLLWSGLLGVLVKLAPVLSAVSRALLLMLGNPIILGAAVVIGGIYLAWKNWDKIAPIVARMVGAVKSHLAVLGSILKAVLNPIEAVRKGFYSLYDKVVGHSYVPDMVEGIRVEMAKLDAVMAQPAAEATSKTAEAFRTLQASVTSLLQSLFPELAKENQLLADVRLLDDAMKAGAISAETYAAALARVTKNAGMTREGLKDNPLSIDDVDGLSDAVFSENSAKIDQAISGLDKVFEDKLAKPAEDKTARVIEAFGQMAAGVVDSLRFMVDSFKSGDILGGLQGILEIVSQVVGVLAQTGIIKGAPSNYGGARAKGGPVVPGKTYLVGENGPEFITPRRNGFVHPNGAAMGGQMKLQVIPSPYFDVVVDGRAQRVAAPMAGHAAIGGAIGAQQSLARRQRHALR